MITLRRAFGSILCLLIGARGGLMLLEGELTEALFVFALGFIVSEITNGVER